MNKTLTVVTEVQKVVFTQVLLPEITTGFWKNARPADHAESWLNVSVVVGSDLGPSGFDVPRNYNFVNPEFFTKAEGHLLDVARSVNADITVKQLKKQLISLNQIIGSRLKEIGGVVTKLPRGRKQGASDTRTLVRNSKNTVRRVAANIVDAPETAEA